MFGVKGKLAPQDRKQVTILNGVVRNHSKKPDEQYEVIEKVSPAPRIELFARHKRKGWDCFGNEVESDVQLITNPSTSASPTFVSQKEFNMGDKVTPSASPKDASHPSHHPNIQGLTPKFPRSFVSREQLNLEDK